MLKKSAIVIKQSAGVIKIHISVFLYQYLLLYYYSSLKQKEYIYIIVIKTIGRGDKKIGLGE